MTHREATAVPSVTVSIRRRAAVRELGGDLCFSKVAMRPGKLTRMVDTSAPPRLRANAGFAMFDKMGRTEFIPVRMIQRGACIRAMPAGPDGSDRLTPLRASAGLAFVSAETGDVAQDDLLTVKPGRDPFNI